MCFYDTFSGYWAFYRGKSDTICLDFFPKCLGEKVRISIEYSISGKYISPFASLVTNLIVLSAKKRTRAQVAQNSTLIIFIVDNQDFTWIVGPNSREIINISGVYDEVHKESIYSTNQKKSHYFYCKTLTNLIQWLRY